LAIIVAGRSRLQRARYKCDGAANWREAEPDERATILSLNMAGAAREPGPEIDQAAVKVGRRRRLIK
jgi:hypothetical protein